VTAALLPASCAAAAAGLAVAPLPVRRIGSGRWARRLPAKAPPGRTSGSWPLASAGLVVLLVLGVPAAFLGTAGIVATATTILRRLGRTRQRLQRRRRLELEVLRSLTAELTAGTTPTEALANIARDLDSDGRSDVEQLLQNLEGHEAVEVPSWPALTAGWRVSAEVGAPLSEIVSRLAAVATAAAQHSREVQAALAGPRSTARLLVGLPVVGLALAALTGAHPLEFLLSPGLGRLCLLVGVGLDVAGLLWIEWLAERAEAT
jgi:tight adherence protein B